MDTKQLVADLREIPLQEDILSAADTIESLQAKVEELTQDLYESNSELDRSNKLYAAGVLDELCKFAATHQCNFDLWLLDKAAQLRKEAE